MGIGTRRNGGRQRGNRRPASSPVERICSGQTGLRGHEFVDGGACECGQRPQRGLDGALAVRSRVGAVHYCIEGSNGAIQYGAQRRRTDGSARRAAYAAGDRGIAGELTIRAGKLGSEVAR